MARIVAVALAAAAAAAYPVPPVVTMEPTIGILSMPLNSTEAPCINAARRLGLLRPDGSEVRAAAGDQVTSCFTARYVKWLEAAGARVAVLPYNADQQEMDMLLSSVNGVLFTGGNLEDLALDTPYMRAAGYVYQRVLAANAAGTFLPLHGTCQGMQVLSILAAQDPSVIVDFEFLAENISLPLDWAAGMPAGSRLFADAPGYILDVFSWNVTENLHHDGLFPATYAANARLQAAFALVSTNTDRKGAPFVSTLEARGAPITATQWHPERVAFEHRPGIGLNHSLASVQANLYVGQHFVDDARRNAQAFPNASLAERYSVYSLINNMTNAADVLSGYQAYVFTY